MPTLSAEVAHQLALLRAHLKPVDSYRGRSASNRGDALQPPAPPCPENGLLPQPFSNCGLPQLPFSTLPWPGNMAYWGGPVQLHPKVYLVYWGWGERGAFAPSKRCRRELVSAGGVRFVLRCDPDGAGKRMAAWVYQLGGTSWAGTTTQYYQGSGGRQRHIANPRNVLAGAWVDDANPAGALLHTSADNAPGSKNTYTDLAREAQRAVAHFRIRDLANADIVIAQSEKFSDPNALAQGYCAFHDYTYPRVENGIYNGVRPGIAFTNMPYILAIDSAPVGGGPGQNLCGQNAVNPGHAGKLDGISIVLGHEIEETVTDPGAEDIVGNGFATHNLGGWYDAFDGYENGDKCAWVGEPLLPGSPDQPNVLPIAGALHNMRGNHGTTFAVQTLWSNQAAGGLGYCAG